MANRASILFSAQTEDGTGEEVDIHPDYPNQEQDFHLVLSGTLDGTFGLEISFDNGVTFVPQLLDGTAFAQTIIGYDKIMSINTPIKVRGILASSTSSVLTAILYHKHKNY